MIGIYHYLIKIGLEVNSTITFLDLIMNLCTICAYLMLNIGDMTSIPWQINLW